MQRYTVYLYLETALHVSGGISIHHQEHTQLYLQYLVLVKTLVLPAAIVESWNWFVCGVGIVLICCGAVADATAPQQISTIPTPHSYQFQIIHNSGREQ
jgi:hypothetical protein